MNYLKRLFFAIKSVFTSTLVGLLSVLVSIFYFVVAMDMFWHGIDNWRTPARTILFHTPLFVEVAAIVVVFVHGFMKKKLQQKTAALQANIELNGQSQQKQSEENSTAE